MRWRSGIWALGSAFALSACLGGGRSGKQEVGPSGGPGRSSAGGTAPSGPGRASKAGSDPEAGGDAKGPYESNSYRYYGRGEDERKGGYTARQKKGRDTWIMWTGGNEKFFRQGTQLGDRVGVSVEYFRLLDSRRRPERFKRLGLINEPNCRQAAKPDKYGLWLDEWLGDPHPESYPDTKVYGEPTGVIGLRKFPNPAFDATKWDVREYFDRPGSVEPPYRIGMTCAFCHMTFHPLNPPADPAEPTWPNLAANLGNQYLHVGGIFFGEGRVVFGGENNRDGRAPYEARGLGDEDFLHHLGETQQRGTSETSRLSYDFINNPNTINSIFFLHNRPSFGDETYNPVTAEEVQKIAGGRGLPAIHHILKDGADSQGIPIASIRVYVNIGMFGEYLITRLWNPLTGKAQEPFDMRVARARSQDWRDTAGRMPDLEDYLATYEPMHLADAPGGKGYIRGDLVPRGKVVFAEDCAYCHSSKGPSEEGPRTALATLKEYLRRAGDKGPEDDAVKRAREAVKQYYRREVAKDDFLEDNTLTDDVRYPVTELGTNAARALATNATGGHLWEQFSSPEYKALPAVGALTLYNPASDRQDRRWMPPAGGRGYYRTASLVSIWATAPYLHNNSVGKFTGDPSVKGRMEAFDDGIRKLLWPDERPGKGSIKVVSTDGTYLYLRIEVLKDAVEELIRLGHPGATLIRSPALPGSFRIPVPKGTPINLLGNIHYKDRIPAAVAYLTYVVKAEESRLPGALGRRAAAEAKEAMDTLLELSQCPDLIEDHGHTYGANLGDADKAALIEYLKTL